MPKASAILRALSSEDIDDAVDEIQSYSVGGKVKIPKIRGGGKRIDELDEGFWNHIRDIIRTMLIRNYNAINIYNSPKYSNWKREAKSKGTEVIVTKDLGKEPVKYIRPALRTGELRERIKDVSVSSRKFRSNVNQGAVEYNVDVSDLFKDYGLRFARLVEKRTGLDIFSLSEEQQTYITELIISELSR